MASMFEQMVAESRAYTTLEEIEKFLQEGQSLAQVPVQPLYAAFQALPIEGRGKALARLSRQQRETFYKIDLWVKDSIDVIKFREWVMAVENCPDEKVRLEFVDSPEFLLYLKGKFNIWTFDVEDPQYPDHDNYFLTEDNQLLFEYHDDTPEIDEAQTLVRLLYAEKGVEDAYSYLFKLISDSYLPFEEDEYRLKKEWLRDYGFVDYYDALELETPYINISVMDAALKKKLGAASTSGEIDQRAKNQTLPKGALTAFENIPSSIRQQLEKVNEQKRIDFLKFNFIRLMNGMLTLDDSLKRGAIAMARTGERTRSTLALGMDYVLIKSKEWGSSSVAFDSLDFCELYRVGMTLIKDHQKLLKKTLRQIGIEEEIAFLGRYWNEVIDESLGHPVKLAQRQGKALELDNLETFQNWSERLGTFIGLAPLLKNLHDVFSKLISEGTLQDSYYLNYNVDEIDFETVLICSMANFYLGRFENPTTTKLGITISEYKKFADRFLSKDHVVIDGDEFVVNAQEFIQTYGLGEVRGIYPYLRDVLVEALEGYDYDNLSDHDFKHVGGPIILASSLNH